MSKSFASLMLLVLISFSVPAQTPEIYSWIRNLTGVTGYNSIPSNVQSVNYTTTDVYIAATCIPGYTIGPWPGNPNTASNQNLVFKITRTPVQNTGTATAIGLGHIGVFTNGVSIFNVSDAMSYNNAGVWNRNAYYWEGSGFDNCLGHPQQQGEYHHHVSPKCLYDATDSSRHSPIIGYAFDGFPVYGAYAYANVNGTGGITRMRTSYAVSTATTRTNGPAVSVQYPAGCFIEDHTYTAGLGTLDARNGRFCVTPEYPNGTYAYFVTIDAAQVPQFPYTFYGSYYGVVQSGNSGPGGGHNTVPGNATGYTATSTPNITIAASNDTICNGASVTFTSTITNGGTAPAYQWKKNGSNIATGSTFTSSSLVNGDVITCVLTSNAYYLTSQLDTSNSVTITLGGNVVPSVVIASSAGTTICTGTNVIFTATPTNGGTTPTYQWKKNNINVGTGITYTDNGLFNNDVVTCVMTSSSSCASPTAATASITMTLSGSITPSITIASNSGNNICSGTNVTFTPTTIGGGNSPTYQWKKNNNNVGTGSTYTDNTLVTGDVINCVLTSSSSCASPTTATSNSITITVSSSLVPSVSILSNGSNTICSGTNVTFTAAPTNGGNNPSYEWMINNTPSGSNSDIFSSSVLSNNDVVKVVMTSNSQCASPSTATSSPITMIVNTTVNATASITVSPRDTICDGDNVVFTAAITNGGNGPLYQWKLNGNNVGASSLIYADNQLQDGDIITMELTSNAVCVSQAVVASAPATMTVYSLPPVPTVLINGNVLTSSSVNNNQWLLGTNIISNAMASTYTAIANGWYSVKVTNEKGCSSKSDSVFVQLTGITEVENQLQLSISPNPFSNLLEIKSNLDLKDVSIKMVDLTGKEILRQQNMTMLSGVAHQLAVAENLSDGIYFLYLQSDKYSSIQKVVKAK